MNNSKTLRLLRLSFILSVIAVISGASIEINAQTRDPFEKPGWAKPRTSSPAVNSSGQPKTEKPKPAGPAPVMPVNAPAIEQRINYYKRLREDAATTGQELPKVTSVLTLDEMAVTGIFRTPRGYAAMVEAKPINLSYTIYPGEKFFDGQLVAVEENRLVFRKIIKMSNGKFVASVENKTLRQYTVQEEVQGTAPVQPTSGKTEIAANQSVQNQGAEPVAAPTVVISPLDEMNRQAVEIKGDSAKDKTDKKGKRTVKVARNKK